MDPLIIYILILLFFALPISPFLKKKFGNKNNNTFDSFFLNINKFLHMEHYRGSFFKKSHLSSSHKFYDIIIIRDLYRGVEYLKIEFKFIQKVSYRFSISNETPASRLKKTFGIDDILAHDKKFDDAILVKTNYIPYITSILKDKIRKNILKISNDNIFHLTNKGITLYTSSFYAPNIVKFQKAMKYIAEHIIFNEDITGQLLNNIYNDSNENVRINNINVYLSYYGENESLESPLKQLMQSKNSEIQIQSAILLKEKGLPFLLELLKKRVNLDEQNIIKIISAFEKSGYEESIHELKKLFVSSKSKKVKIQILSNFKKTYDETVISFLLDELKIHDSEITLKIIETLGYCGTIEVVETLYRLGKKTIKRSQKKAIQKAIANIQSRLGPVESGWLSKLSRSKKEGGLSIKKDADEGSLSIEE